MKTIGLIGGTSWISTVDYYTEINRSTNRILGGLHSAKILLYSVDFLEFKQYLDRQEWDKISVMFCDIAKKLEQAKVDFIAITANTPHIIADQLRESITIPLLHIAEATAILLSHEGLKKVALLGTKPTMEALFFKTILEKYGIEQIVPDEDTREFLHQVIFSELAHGVNKPETKERVLKAINALQKRGAEGVIFGCTELSFLIKEKESILPVFDTTSIHIDAIVQQALFSK